MATNITDLPIDVISKILSAVAKAPDGARDIARSMPTCQLFLEASNSNAVRRVVCFDHAQILRRTHLFRKTNGLLSKCAKTYNPSAEFQLAQVILTTSTKVGELKIHKERLNIFRGYCPRGRGRPRDDAVIASFITHFTPAQGTDPNPSQEPVPRSLSYHWEFVKVFILKATPMDVIYMRDHVHNYVALFTAGQFYSADVSVFMGYYSLWLSCGTTNVDTSIMVRAHYFYLFNRESSVPPQNIEGSVGPQYREVKARVLFEAFRVKVLDAFEVIIPKLY